LDENFKSTYIEGDVVIIDRDNEPPFYHLNKGLMTNLGSDWYNGDITEIGTIIYLVCYVYHEIDYTCKSNVQFGEKIVTFSLEGCSTYVIDKNDKLLVGKEVIGASPPSISGDWEPGSCDEVLVSADSEVLQFIRDLERRGIVGE
jgi:hypothetical protein